MKKKQTIEPNNINGGVDLLDLSYNNLSDSIIKEMPIGIVVINAKGHIKTINPRALEIFDLNRNDIKRSNGSSNPTVFTGLFPVSEKKRWQYMINTVITTKDNFTEDRYFHNTGYVEKILSVKISPVLLPPNSSDGLIITVDDISDKILNEKYIILSEKLVAKGEMVAAIAHELSNYLAIAANNAELLSRNIKSEKFDKAKFNSQTIVENIFEIKKIINNLISFANPDTQFISFDIKTLIKDIILSLRIQPRFKNTSFTIDLKDNIPNIEMDVSLIQQLLMNIFTNAADAMEEKKIQNQNSDYKNEIAVLSSFDARREELYLIISDNGIGISEENINKIYNMHFTTKKNGHGLGLFNGRKIIKQHHGEIICESQEGEGSTFKITLPRFQPKVKEEKSVTN